MTRSNFILALGAALTAVVATQAVAATFDASRIGASKQTLSRADGRAAVGYIKSIGGGSGGVRKTDSYCVWEGSDGKWHAKKVNLLTQCINSFKVTCTDGQCSVD